MTNYYPAEALADSPRSFTFAEVGRISTRCNVATDRMGVKRFTRPDRSAVFRLFAIGAGHSDRTEAYSAAGSLGVHIAINGGLMPGFGQVCVLEHFAPARPGMEHNTEWHH